MEDDFLGYFVVVVKDNHPPQRTVKGDCNMLHSNQNGEELEEEASLYVAPTAPCFSEGQERGQRAGGGL